MANSTSYITNNTKIAFQEATKIADHASILSLRSCGIAIANESNYTLKNPAIYNFYGGNSPLTEKIEKGEVGVFLVQGYFNTSGVFTFDLDCPSKKIFKKVQAKWNVPFFGPNRVHVNIGNESASETLYQEMKYRGILLDSNIEKYPFEDVDLKIEVCMNERYNAALSLTISSITTPKSEPKTNEAKENR